jgi:hypothetical protein
MLPVITNVMIGWQAGANVTTGDDNIFIGRQAGFNEGGNHKLYINQGFEDNPLIYGEFDNDLFRINGKAQIKKKTSNADPLLQLTETSTTYATIEFKKSNAGGQWRQSAYCDPSYQNSFQMNFFANEFEEMSLNGNGDLTIWGDLYEYSDSTLKENIKPIQNTLAGLQNIHPVTYYWKDKNRKAPIQEIGFLAQEVERSFPQLVHTDEKGEKSVSYTHMVPVLLNAIKEQQAEIEELKTRQNEIDEMRVKMDLMEGKLRELTMEKK